MGKPFVSVNKTARTARTGYPQRKDNLAILNASSRHGFFSISPSGLYLPDSRDRRSYIEHSSHHCGGRRSRKRKRRRHVIIFVIYFRTRSMFLGVPCREINFVRVASSSSLARTIHSTLIYRCTVLMRPDAPKRAVRCSSRVYCRGLQLLPPTLRLSSKWPCLDPILGRGHA